MAKPGRKKKKKELTVNSDETKIFFGMILVILGLSFLSAPFVDAQIFEFITKYVGYSAIPFGLSFLYLSMRFFASQPKLTSNRILFGLITLAVSLSTMLTFWVPQELLVESTSFSDSGGQLGYITHLFLFSNIGQLVEFVILIFILLIAFSLLTDIKLTQIRDFFEKAFPQEEDGSDIKINGIVNGDVPSTAGKTNIPNSETDEKAQKRVEDLFSNIGKGSKKKKDETSGPTVNNSNKTEKTDKEGENLSPMYKNWVYPPLNLLLDPVVKPQNDKVYKKNALIIEQTLKSFNVQAKVVDVSVGPTVVQYALSISVGTKVSKIRNLGNDLALALAAPSSTVRIEAPIPGTSLVGIEMPNPTPNFVYIKDMMTKVRKEGKKHELPLILGKDVAGKYITKDLVDMPHLLVAGATGTGKSVGINSIIMGMLMSKSPDEVKLILVDPKMVEMAPYNGIPHLLTPVITDMELVVNSLQWAIEEMMKRYRILKQVGVRKISEYNQKAGHNAMPYIVIIIDEMADLMLTAGVDVESKVVRLTQMSRAVGIHLILATQRPSVDVITGLIKANVPGRIGFSVATAIDSRVIIDQVGADSLLGNGDMLFKSPAHPRPIRVQGAYTDTKDLEKVVEFIKEQTDEVEYSEEVTARKGPEGTEASGGSSDDPLFNQAADLVISAQKGSASMLQRKLRVGYNRAARLIDELEEAGIVGAPQGSGPRKVLKTSLDAPPSPETALPQ